MADSSTPTDTSETSSEPISVSHSAANGSSATPDSAGPEAAAEPVRRKVYHSDLIPERKSRRAPSTVVLVVLLVVAGGIGYLVYGPHARRQVNTVGKISYAASDTVDGPSKVWIASADGSSPKSLSSTSAAEDSPSFSPDGNQIVFVSTRQGGNRQVYVMDADGQNIRQVTSNSGAKQSPTFAPAGNDQLLSFVTSGHLFLTDVGAGDTEQLLPPAPKQVGAAVNSGDTDNAQNDSNATVEDYFWAPGAKTRDSQELAAALDTGSNQVLALFTSIEKDPMVTTTDPEGHNVALAEGGLLTLGWSSDGGLLAVAVMGTSNADIGRCALLLFSATGSPQPPIIPPALFQTRAKVLIGPEHPVFSPDGTQVFFEVWAQKDLADRRCAGLFSAAVGGGSPPKPIVRGDAEKVQFSADGQTLYYLTKRPDGGHDLCAVGLDGTGQRRVSDGKQDVTDFSVSPQKAASGGA